MTTNIATVILLVALGLIIESTIINDESISGSDTVCTMSNPGGNQFPPPQ
jgi:hypothetical protein